jgi:hypothetical protein
MTWGGASLEMARLNVTGASACPPGAVSAPPPSTSEGDAWLVLREAEESGVLVTASFRKSHCNAQLTIWYDANGDGVVSSGDFVGSTPIVEIRDRGLFSGNLTRGPDVRLRRVP